jgi:phosphoenolpyruvate---glycerone phosphotransferase subunit DhaL
MAAIGAADVVRWFESLARVYTENRQWLTDLDAAIGDADHGSNMDRGFAAAAAELQARPPATPRAAFDTAAAVLIRTVGGAAGPLYGTFFLRAGAAIGVKTELDAADLLAAFEAGAAGVKQRGKAEPGDKTMLDVLLPACAAMRQALERGRPLEAILDAAVSAAEAGVAATVPLVARKGRASYLGERSAGHQDPGATSSWLMFRAAAAVFKE